MNRPVKLFISYAHEDASYRDAFIKHLSGLEKHQGIIQSWKDQQIKPGEIWDNEIRTALKQADIVVFLISADFMKSDYINDIEIKQTLKRYKNGVQTILPVLIRACDFESLNLSLFSALPVCDETNKLKPVSLWEDKHNDKAWLNVINGIKKVIAKTTTPTTLTKEGKKVLHEFHKHTSNRKEQRKELDANPENQFFSILGEEKHAHFGLVKRFALEESGEIFKKYDIDRNKLHIGNIVLQNLSGQQHYKLRFLRELYANFEINLDNEHSLLDKGLDYICANSPVLRGADYVCLLISIDEDEWHTEDTPSFLSWFIEEICVFKNSTKIKKRPKFFFFFGIVSEENEVNLAIKEELDKNTNIVTLPKLDMVSRKDIVKWFKKHASVFPNTNQREALINKHFNSSTEFAMEDVEIEFSKIIDTLNEQAI